MLSQSVVDTNFVLEYSRILSLDVYPKNVVLKDICGSLKKRTANIYPIESAGLYFIEVFDDLDECKYIIAFSSRLGLFYKLTGFRTSDLQVFSNDLTTGEKGLLHGESLKKNAKSQLLDTILCLLEYVDSPRKKKKNKYFPCVYDCDKTVQLH